MLGVSDAVKQRRTVRGFKPDPVPDAIICEILEIARYAPSNCNTQPWHLTLVSGELRQQLEKALLDHIAAGNPPTPEFKPGDADLAGVYRERQVDCALRYYGVMGIERHEKEKRTALAMKNWQFFGAPHVAFLSMPVSMGPVNAVDIGIYLQTLMLLLVERGLASCPQGALAFYPEPIKKLIGIPEGHGIICGLSFGYEDVGAKINEVTMERAPLETTVTMVSS